MNLRVKVALAAGILATVSSLFASTIFKQPAPQPAPIVNPPPPETRFTRKVPTHKWIDTGDLRGDIKYDTLAKTFTLQWRLADGTSREQTWSLAYYPTEAIRIAGAIILAGKKLNGDTLIEKRTYTAPPIGTTGTGQHTIGNTLVSGASTIYSATVAGKDTVKVMRQSVWNANVLVLQFLDSHDVYSLNLMSNGLTKLAGVGATAPAVAASGLAADHNHLWFGEHVAYGYVTVFGSSVSSTDPVVLFDVNKDGIPESASQFTAATWRTSGLESMANFTQVK
jgi:hypothetical protein